MNMKLDERYERMARELAVEAHCRYCDRTSAARTKCARDVEDSASQIALALERAAVEATANTCAFYGDDIRADALRKRLKELKEGGR